MQRSLSLFTNSKEGVQLSIHHSSATCSMDERGERGGGPGGPVGVEGLGLGGCGSAGGGRDAHRFASRIDKD